MFHSKITSHFLVKDWLTFLFKGVLNKLDIVGSLFTKKLQTSIRYCANFTIPLLFFLMGSFG